MNGDVTHRLLGAGCGESRTSGSEGEVHRSNADIDSNYTVTQARAKVSRTVIGVGILPPHLQATPERRDDYAATLLAAGASVIFSNVQELTMEEITRLTINN